MLFRYNTRVDTLQKTSKPDVVDRLVAWGCRLLHLTKYQGILTQLAKFTVAGVINTAVDWGIFFSLYNLLHVDPVLSQAISFTIATIISFFINTIWVFNTTKNKTRSRLIAEFFVLNLIALGITTVLIYLFIDRMHMNELLAKILTTVITMIYNYITRKLTLEDRKAKN